MSENLLPRPERMTGELDLPCDLQSCRQGNMTKAVRCDLDWHPKRCKHACFIAKYGSEKK